jgi:NAD(P)-dependent dehydrogenase (short-subunit alcohol dehydrogenase family)
MNKPQDPRTKEAQPPFPDQNQKPPGTEAEMQPKADHGESSYRGCGKLEGFSALITGGDSGIGRAAALAIAREGADVLISYLNEEQDARESQRLVEEAGRKAVIAGGDIADEVHCQKLVRQAVDEFGKINILVNNAAFQRNYKDISEISAEEWDYTFRTNIYAMFYLAKAVVPHMQPGSSIINVASIQAYQPSPNLLAYATTKGAIVTFSKALAYMLAEKGVRVNCVAPGPVWTPLIPSTMPDEKSQNFGKDSLLNRPAQPAELAPIFVFLASPEASYVTGEVYGATGGRPIA